MSNEQKPQGEFPNTIKLGASILLLGPGIALVGAAAGLILLALAILIVVSLSGVIALAFVTGGGLMMLGGLILWPVRKHVTIMISAALGAMLTSLLNTKK